MRKIKTMEDIERVRRRNGTILSVFIIFLLLFSYAGFAVMSGDSDDESVVNENGFDFVRDGGLWKLAIGSDNEAEEVFGFQNLPSEVSDIKIDVNAELGQYNGQPLYFVNPGEGTSEILGNIGKYVLRYQEACLDQGLVVRDQVSDDLGNVTFDDLENISIDGNESLSLGSEAKVACKGDLPIKDCSQNLIIFETGNETRVYSEGNCVFIVGDVLKGSDAFLYKILGIN